MKITRIALPVIVVMLPAAIVVMLPAASRADDSALPQEVRAALQKNARALTDLTIAGTYSRRMLAPAGKALAALGTLESEAEFTQPIKFELRLQGAKIYESIRSSRTKYQSEDQLDEICYDGTKYYSGSVDASGPDKPALLIITAPAILQEEDRTRTPEAPFLLWYLVEAGFSGPDHAGELGRSIESLVLARSAHGRIESVKAVGQESQKLVEVVVAYPEPWASSATIPIENDDSIQKYVGDSKKLQVRMERERRQLRGQKRLDRFLLDGALGYAVREKWESRAASGAVLFHTTNSDFQQVEPGGVWLPRRCEVVSHAYATAPVYTSPKPLYATEIQIEKIERTTLSDEQFRLWYDRPGARVTDHTHSRATAGRPYNYIVPASLEGVAKAGSSKRALIIIIANGLLAAILVWVVYARSRRGARAGAGHATD
jgi:hypothetical protein